MFTESLGTLQIWLRLLAAVACGGVLGWERETAHKNAGFRTHIMVSLGAATFTLVAAQIYFESASLLSGSPGDPTRVIQGIITGIGFLGAGAILRGDHGVRGLTTAASIWVVGALGAACGAGVYKVAALGTVHALIVLTLLGKWERRHDRKRRLKIDNDFPEGDDEDEDDTPSLPAG